ncbi:MAG: STAS domain-containing protein [Bacilli bacterium]|jgi:anti-anti-sigma factor|nr:STAS domain-containing protein [Bacilli bacterium]
MLKVDMEYDKGILYVRLNGVLERKVSYKINNYIVPTVLKHKVKYLVFNLLELKDIDESGMDALLNTKCAIRTNRGKICLCEVSDEVREKIKRLRMKIASNELAANKLIEI